jgi:hypothetical protein
MLLQFAVVKTQLLAEFLLWQLQCVNVLLCQRHNSSVYGKQVTGCIPGPVGGHTTAPMYEQHLVRMVQTKACTPAD